VQKYKGVEASERTKGILLIEIDGEEAEVESQKESVEDICRRNGALEVRTTTDSDEMEEIWDVRKSISPALYTIARKKINEDICVPRSAMSQAFSRIEEIGKRHNVTIAKFGHAGDGNVHINVLVDDEDPETLKPAHAAIKEIMRTTVDLGGTLSGEHGIGIAKSPYLQFEIAEKEMELMRTLKRVFDPNNILNPGKIFPE
jgi:glycolate oxidase